MVGCLPCFQPPSSLPPFLTGGLHPPVRYFPLGTLMHQSPWEAEAALSTLSGEGVSPPLHVMRPPRRASWAAPVKHGPLVHAPLLLGDAAVIPQGLDPSKLQTARWACTLLAQPPAFPLPFLPSASSHGGSLGSQDEFSPGRCLKHSLKISFRDFPGRSSVRLCNSTAGATGSIPGQANKIPKLHSLPSPPPKKVLEDLPYLVIPGQI